MADADADDALDLSASLQPADSQRLQLELASRPSLQLLELQANGLSCAGVAILVQALRSPGCAGRLRYLGLAQNGIGESGGCSLAAWLATAGVPLQTIELRDNSLGDRAASAFASMLTRNQQLQVRVHARTKHSPAARHGPGPSHRIGPLAPNTCASRLPPPQHLSLLHNAIGRHGALALAKALSVNSTLATLDLRLNLIDEHELQAIMTHQAWATDRGVTAAATPPRPPHSLPAAASSLS